MRISDWSSDVCSSDLKPQGPKFQHDLAIKALVEIGACHARQKLVLRIVASRVTDHSLLLRELLVQPERIERIHRSHPDFMLAACLDACRRVGVANQVHSSSCLEENGRAQVCTPVTNE